MAAHTDDAFHEIQLNGKQLVFLFMAATVVSVVIFLCGVLVGRGVRAERGDEAEIADAATITEPAPHPSAASTPPPASDPTTAAAPPAPDDLTYYDRLGTTTAAVETLKPVAPETAPRAAERAPAAPARTAAAEPSRAAPPRATAAPPVSGAPTPAPGPTASGPPSGTGYTVQIAALNIRSEADAIAKRMASKGYAAYVTSPTAGTPQIYRVRIGKFGSRREADAIATKLKTEEQFNPWVTR